MSVFWGFRKINDQTGVGKAEAGVSLLEVVVALVLTLLLVESLLQLMLTGINGIGRSGQITTACTYVESLLEEMKVHPEILNGLPEQTTVDAADLPFSVPAPAGVEVYISLAPLDGGSALCQVRLKVLSTRGSRQWEEILIGLVPTPANQK